jgi:hypothetical protein
MDIRAYNREAWNKEVEQGNPWTIPASHEQIQQTRQGVWSIVLTPSIPVPENWFPDFKGRPVLCLASGGGQQGPIHAYFFCHESAKTQRLVRHPTSLR